MTGVSAGLAAWVLERLLPTAYGEALTGDLLEESAGGRSAVWVWGQVLAVFGERLRSWARRCALPVAFSTAWSMLSPAWDGLLWRGALPQRLFERWSALDWPYSASLVVAGGVLPVATFIWVGLFVYLGLGLPHAVRPTALRVVASLSLSVSVLLVLGIGLRAWLGIPEVHAMAFRGLTILSPTPFRLADSILAAASLLVGILFASAAPSGRRRSALAQ